MLSRQKKKRAKRRAKYLEVRDDVLESARASYEADPEKKRTADSERERYHADPEKKQTAEREGIKQTQKRNRPLNESGIKQTQKRNRPLNESGIKQTQKRNRPLNESGIKQTQKRNRPLNESGIKQTQKRNGPLKGNVIGRVLNVLAWRRECGTGRLSVVPCKTNEAIENVLPTKLYKGM